MTSFLRRTSRLTAAHWGAYRIDETDPEAALVPLESDPLPSRIGRGWLSAARDGGARIRRPAIRRGWLTGDRGAARNEDAFVEVPWDEALGFAASEIARVREQFGNGAIYGGSYGWASAGRFHHAQSQLRRFLNLAGGYVAARDTYSHAAGEVILPHITGMSNKQFEEGLTSWPLIAQNCEILLAFGGISTRTAQITAGGTSEHEVGFWMAQAAAAGMQTLCVSPLRSDAPAIAGSSWIPIRPNSDVALMLALCHELFENRWHDESFLARYTSGWQAFRSYVGGTVDGIPKSPKWAAPLCDLPEADIRDLAARLHGRKVMVSVAWGLQRADHGEQAVWAGLALAALLGQIGAPGTGFGFGYGSTTPPGRPKRFVAWPSVPQGVNPVSDFIPVARLADMLLFPRESYHYNGASRKYPDIRLVYWAGGNPFHHHQDLFRLEHAWTRPETVIVHDHSWTATARRADIVLPCTSPLEREDIMMNPRNPRLVFMSRVIEPQGEARDDFAIFAALSRRMGFGDEFDEGRDASEWLSWLWDRARAVGQREGFALPDLDDFKRMGQWVIPDEDRVRIQFEDYVRDPAATPLRTESGRITLFNEAIARMRLPDCPGHPAWLEPAEWTFGGDVDALHLISNQPDTRLHSQLDNGNEARSAKARGREICLIHENTARRFGISDGDVVRLFNARGACLASARCTRDMREDCVVLPTGAWLDIQNTPVGRIDVHGNPNVLTMDKGTSGLAQGNISHTTLVRIEKWTYPLPPIRVHSQPDFVAPEEAGHLLANRSNA